MGESKIKEKQLMDLFHKVTGIEKKTIMAKEDKQQYEKFKNYYFILRDNNFDWQKTYKDTVMMFENQKQRALNNLQAIYQVTKSKEEKEDGK